MPGEDGVVRVELQYFHPSPPLTNPTSRRDARYDAVLLRVIPHKKYTVSARTPGIENRRESFSQLDQTVDMIQIRIRIKIYAPRMNLS